MKKNNRSAVRWSLGLCLWLPAAGFAADKDLGRKLFAEGLASYRKGDLTQSAATFSKSIEAYPRLLQAYAARALAYHSLGNGALMRQDAQKASSLSGNDMESLIARGNLQVLMGDPAKAIEIFDLALQKDKANADAHLGRGRAWRARGNWASAILEWSEAVKLNPDLLMAYFNRAQAYHETGDTAKAMEDLTRALRSNPKFPLPYALLGVIFAEKGDLQRSIKSYSRAIALHPQYAYAHLGRAAVHLLNKDKPAAFNDYTEALRSAPEDYAGYFNRGEASWRLGDKNVAVTDFRKALMLDPRETPAILMMGDRLMQEGLNAEAAAAYNQGVQAAAAAPPHLRDPWMDAALLKRAEVRIAMRDYSKALQDLDEAVRISSHPVQPLTARAGIHLRMSRADKAQEDIDHAMALDQKYAPAHVELGNLLALNGKAPQALEEFNAALRLDPNLTAAYRNRALLYANQLQDYERAFADFSAAIRLSPDDQETYYNLAATQFKHHAFSSALDSLSQAILLRPPTPQMLQLRTQAYYSLGNLTAVLKDIRDALQADPDNAGLYLNLASIRLRYHDPAQALNDLGKAARILPPKTFDLRFLMGMARAASGQYQEAAKELTLAVGLRPKSAEAYGALCRALRLDRRFPEAVRACDKSVAINPKHGPAYIDRGLAEISLRQYDKAVLDLRQGAQTGARYPQAELARSFAHAALAQWSESDAAYRSAMDLDPAVTIPEVTFGEKPPQRVNYSALISGLDKLMARDATDPSAHLVRGNAHHNAGFFGDAVEAYTKAMELDDKLAPAYMDRCAAHADRQLLEMAEKDCRRAVELEPKDPQAHARLVTLLILSKKFQAALTAAVEATQTLPGSAALCVRSGDARQFLKDLRRAKEDYLTALSLDPAAAEADNGMGLALFEEGRYQEAVEYFSRAIAINPRNDRFWANRASAYVRLSDYANAGMDYKNALAVSNNPETAAAYRKSMDQCAAKTSPRTL